MRNWLIAAVVCAVLGMALVAPASAADSHGDAKAEPQAKGKPIGVEKGLFIGAIETTLWTIVVFLVLFFVLRAFAWKPIVEGLNKREQTIAHDKRDAELAKQEAAQMRERLAAEQAKAAAEVRAMIDKARADAQQTAADELARGKTELATERERMYREVGIARDAMQKEVFDNGAKLAALLSAKAIKKQLTEHDHRALLDEALREFRAAADARKHDLENATA